MAVDRGRVLALGNDTEILTAFSELGEIVDLGGRAVLPGLTDAHIHLQHYALGLQAVDCETSSRAECLSRVAERARQTPPRGWILGHGWNHNEWPDGFGSATELDRVAPQHPVYLTAKSLHAAWANSLALHQAGITADLPDPEGGSFLRDRSGNPTGILLEGAMTLVANQIPEPSPAQVANAIRDAQNRLWSFGLTGVHDFDRQTCFAALQILHANAELGLRVVKSIPLEALPHAVGLGLRTGFGDDFLRIGGIKIFSDGALGPRTAAMLQPYEAEPDNRGMLLLDAEEIYEHGRLALANGLSLAVHAIGDRANHEVLNAYAQLRIFERDLIAEHSLHPAKTASPATAHVSPQRLRIEHVQIIHPQDAPRLAQLGIIASMQPIHATSDFPAADRYWGERAEQAYAWQTLLQLGTRLAFGSDAPVESPNPFWGLHAAITRRRADGSPSPEGWYSNQRLELLEALRGFTLGAAYAAGLEDRLGRLAPGFLADLIVLETDPFTCPPDQLHALRVLGTMVSGKWVYLDAPLNDLISSAAHPPGASLPQ
ncbi:MAG TPA: amidohydrolase [Anaerolineales bacterium]|nr:amidohydrolase [Anaerolineales bacterium]